MVIDSVMLADIFITFLTDNSEPHERNSLTNWKIAQKYISGYFFFDLASSLPGIIVLERRNGADP